MSDVPCSSLAWEEDYTGVPGPKFEVCAPTEAPNRRVFCKEVAVKGALLEDGVAHGIKGLEWE